MLLKNGKAISILLIMIFCALLSILAYKFRSQYSYKPLIKSGVFDTLPIWDIETQNPITSSLVADNNDHIFIRTSDSIIALNSLSGDLIWSAKSQSDTPLSVSPYVFEDYLVVPEEGSRIAVFKTATGELLWRTMEIEAGQYSPRIESIVHASNMLYIARFDWSLTAYRITDGAIVWEQKYSTRFPPSISASNKIVILGLGTEISAFDALEGTLIWKKNINSNIGRIILRDNILFISDISERGLVAFNMQTQEVLWRKLYDAISNDVIGCIDANDDTIFISARRLIAVSLIDGNTKWVSEETGNLECPVILGDTVYVRNTHKLLFAFDLTSGQEVGRISVQANTPMLHEPDRGPVGIDGILIVPITEHYVAAYLLGWRGPSRDAP